METLRNYQAEAVNWLADKGSAILAFDTGIGKTAVVMKLIERLKLTKHILYVCPATLKYEIVKEAKLWLPGFPVNVIHGTPKERAKQWKNRAGITIVNYELILKDWEIMPLGWSLILADEGHRISSHKAKITKLFLKKLKSERRIIMTATPILTRPEQIHSLIEWLSPGRLSNFWSFRLRYCVLNHWGSIVSYRGLDELNARIKDLIIRKDKREVEKSLPPLTIINVPVELNANERRLYDIVKQELLFQLKQNDLSIPYSSLGTSVVNMTRLRQICASLELVSDIHKDSSKIAAMKEKLEEILAGTDEKVVIYSQYSKLLDVIAREIAEYKPLVIQGSVSAEDRSAAITAFTNDKTRRVMLISQAGSQGTNLQAAANLIMMDLHFSHGQNLQTVGRIERIGQARPMFVYNLTAIKTVDVHIAKKLENRKDMIEQVLSVGEMINILEE